MFVDPDAALKATLVVTRAERIVVDGDPRVYLHVRIGNRSEVSRVRLFAEAGGERFELPLEDAHVQSCGFVETCLSITLGPGLPIEAARLGLAVPELGVESVAPLAIVELGRYLATAEAEDGNQVVRVQLVDPIRGYFSEPELARLSSGDVPIVLFPRAFEALTLPGACGDAVDPVDPAWLPTRDVPFAMSAAFDASDDPHACVSFRPALPRGGPAAGAATARARALVTRFEHTYVPPVEVAPLVYVPLFDLELPNERRCVEARDLVGSAILEAATEIASSDAGGAEVLALDAEEIATAGGVSCRQANDRRIDGVQVAERIQSAIDAAFGADRRVRVLLVYATNLDLPPPEGLVDGVRALRAALRSRARRGESLVTLGPDRAIAPFEPDAALAWLATDEPMFRDTMKALLRVPWPFRTVLHTAETVVPLVASRDRDRFAAFKVCTASQEVWPLGTADGGALVPEALGPAYRAILPEQELTPADRFVRPAITVSWEGCEGLCDHVAPDDPSSTAFAFPWDVRPGCS